MTRRGVLAVVVERADVAAGAERFAAGAREHDGIDSLVRFDLLEALREVVHHREVQRIQHLGAAELDCADADVLAVDNVSVVVVRFDGEAARRGWRERGRSRAHGTLEETHARGEHTLHRHGSLATRMIVAVEM